jgi:hypothetical protein
VILVVFIARTLLSGAANGSHPGSRPGPGPRFTNKKPQGPSRNLFRSAWGHSACGHQFGVVLPPGTAARALECTPGRVPVPAWGFGKPGGGLWPVELVLLAPFKSAISAAVAGASSTNAAGPSATELAKSPGWTRDSPWDTPGPGKAPQCLGFAHVKARSRQSQVLAKARSWPGRPPPPPRPYLRSKSKMCFGL